MTYFRARGSLGDTDGRAKPTRHTSLLNNPPPPFPKPAFAQRALATRHTQHLNNPPPPLPAPRRPFDARRYPGYWSPPLDPPTHDRVGTLGSLGADEPEMSEVQWRTAMLSSQHDMVAWQERWVKRDELQRWLQFGATLAIPLSAAIWRAIFKGARGGE